MNGGIACEQGPTTVTKTPVPTTTTTSPSR